jgi:transposase
MQPVFAKGNTRTIEKLLDLRRQAQRDKAPRVLLRLQGILMSLDGLTVGEIAQRLRVHRSTVPLWIDHWNHFGEEGLLEGQRSGRPVALEPKDREKLTDILDSGPVAYGLETGIWTSPLVSQIIREEFGLAYHPGHVRKLLKQLGYSLQRPTTRLIQADLRQKRKWVRYTYPNLKKTPKSKGR